MSLKNKQNIAMQILYFVALTISTLLFACAEKIERSNIMESNNSNNIDLSINSIAYAIKLSQSEIDKICHVATSAKVDVTTIEDVKSKLGNPYNEYISSGPKRPNPVPQAIVLTYYIQMKDIEFVNEIHDKSINFVFGLDGTFVRYFGNFSCDATVRP